MNYLLVFVFLFSSCLAQDDAKFSQYEEECITELNFNKNEVMESFNQYLFPEDNEHLKKIFVCVWKKENIIDANGNILEENFKRYLVNYFQTTQGGTYLVALLATADTMHHCENVHGKTVEDTAIKMANCVLRRIETYYR